VEHQRREFVAVVRSEGVRLCGSQAVDDLLHVGRGVEALGGLIFGDRAVPASWNLE
jgi:hypothetical protein